MTLSDLVKLAKKAYGEDAFVDYNSAESFSYVGIYSSHSTGIPVIDITDTKALEMAAAAIKVKLPGPGRPRKKDAKK